jgi:hypothetical protein
MMLACFRSETEASYHPGQARYLLGSIFPAKSFMQAPTALDE